MDDSITSGVSRLGQHPNIQRCGHILLHGEPVALHHVGYGLPEAPQVVEDLQCSSHLCGVLGEEWRGGVGDSGTPG